MKQQERVDETEHSFAEGEVSESEEDIVDNISEDENSSDAEFDDSERGVSHVAPVGDEDDDSADDEASWIQNTIFPDFSVTSMIVTMS